MNNLQEEERYAPVFMDAGLQPVIQENSNNASATALCKRGDIVGCSIISNV